MAEKTITSANAILLLGVTGLFDIALQMQGFTAEDIFDAEGIDTAETVMGVDARLSAGWVATTKKMSISLQADSDSVDFFERWYSAERSVREKYFGFGSIYLRSVQKKYNLVRVVLKNYKPLPDGKKVLQGRKFMLEMQDIEPSAI